jgi:calmodulin
MARLTSTVPDSHLLLATLKVLTRHPEFLDIMATPSKPLGDSKDELVSAFQVFDKDGSGSVSSSELRSVLISLGQKHTDEEIDEMVKHADLDGNGSIDCKFAFSPVRPHVLTSSRDQEFVQLMAPKK